MPYDLLRHIALLTVLLAGPAYAHNPPSSVAKTVAAQENDSVLIQQLEADWLAAERSTDPAALERILSDEFVNLAPNGLAPGKAELIKNWKAHAGQAPAYTVETSDMHFYILGSTAVAAFEKTYTAKENGKVIHEATAHVFTKENGSWKLRISRSSFH